MTAPAAAPAPTARMFVVHGIYENAGVTVVQVATGHLTALVASELPDGWIHDATLTSCPRCAAALDLAVAG